MRDIIRNPYVWAAFGLLALAGGIVYFLQRKGLLASLIQSLPTLPGMTPNAGAILLAPIAGGVVTSGYGMRVHPVTGVEKLHNGVDYRAAVGTAVLAPADGVVKSIYYNSAGGNQMTVEHDNGYTTGYAHLSGYEVAVGSRVTRGQVIAKTGNTGATTGPHLHFTVRRTGSSATMDPIALLA